jgi:hypothetical protein
MYILYSVVPVRDSFGDAHAHGCHRLGLNFVRSHGIGSYSLMATGAAIWNQLWQHLSTETFCLKQGKSWQISALGPT